MTQPTQPVARLLDEIQVLRTHVQTLRRQVQDDEPTGMSDLVSQVDDLGQKTSHLAGTLNAADRALLRASFSGVLADIDALASTTQQRLQSLDRQVNRHDTEHHG